MKFYLLIAIIVATIGSACDEAQSSTPEVPSTKSEEGNAQPASREAEDEQGKKEKQQAIDRTSDHGLSGRYTMKMEIGMFNPDEEDFETVEVENCLTLRELPDDSVEYSALMLFTNAHICELSGVATLTDEGFYRHVVEEEFFGKCILDLHIDDEQIRLGDESGTCRQIYCGARGHLDGMAFPRDSQAPQGESSCGAY